MTPQELARLERLEQFVERLTLHSYVAKAAAEGTRAPAFDHPARLKRLEERMDALEEGGRDDTLAPADPELHNTLVAIVKRLRQVEERLEAHVTGTVQEGERVLAKAQQARRRNATPDGILERAMRVLPDPVQVGVVQGYLADGLVAKAAQVVEEAEARQDQQEGAEALKDLDRDFDEHADLVTIAKLTEEVQQLNSVVTALLRRVVTLEQARAQAPMTATATSGETVAKGGDIANTPEGLLARLHAVVDSPTLMGALSSKLQSGRPQDLAEVRRTVELAELRRGRHRG